MINSMTAFARASAQYDWGNVAWEMRSVNHRYLDVSFKMPEAQRGLEMDLRERMREHVGRGKVECSLRLQRHGGGAQGLAINQPLLQQLIVAVAILKNRWVMSVVPIHWRCCNGRGC